MSVNVSYTITVILSLKDTEAYGRSKRHTVPYCDCSAPLCDIPTTDDA